MSKADLIAKVVRMMEEVDERCCARILGAASFHLSEYVPHRREAQILQFRKPTNKRAVEGGA